MTEDCPVLNFLDYLEDHDPDAFNRLTGTTAYVPWISEWRRQGPEYIRFCVASGYDYEDVKCQMTGRATAALDPNALRQLGELLWGPRWQTAMARALGVNARTVRRWAVGDSPISGPVAVTLFALRDAKAPLKRQLIEASQRTGVPQAEIIRRAVADYIGKL